MLALLPLYPSKNEGSRYPQLIPFLAPYQQSQNLLFIGAGINEVNLKLLADNKADYALSFSSNVNSQIKLNQLNDDFIFYSLEENQQYKKIYVSCSNTKKGKQVIKEVNKLINGEFLNFIYQQTKQWNNNPKFLTAIREYYLQNGKSENVIED